MTVSVRERCLGSLLGLAVGDALGTTLEFRQPATFAPLEDMEGGGPFGLKAGQWTDDTSMALCLAHSLLECCTFDPYDQLRRYLRWQRKGYMSSTGHCFDIGNTVSTALVRFAETGSPYPGSTHPMSAGNGSLMRLAPVPILYRRHPRCAVHYAALSSRTTHGAHAAVDACRYVAGLLVGALSGVKRETLLRDDPFEPFPGLWAENPLASEVEEVARGSFRRKWPPAIRGSGYVVESLEAALWALHAGDGFDEGCLLAVNLGDDADTTGAIYGQLAGAIYGIDGINPDWIYQLAEGDLLWDTADRLYRLSCRLPESFLREPDYRGDAN